MTIQNKGSKAVYTSSRAAAYKHNSSGVSQPAVQSVQKVPIQKKAVDEGIFKDTREINPFPVLSDHKNDQTAATTIQPFQLNANNTGLPNKLKSGIEARQGKHLPHEAWHVVQQKQGRVKPTMQMKEGLIQRAIIKDDTQYSFQSIYDENGNPFLKMHGTEEEEGYARINIKQPGLDIDEIEYADTFLDVDDEEQLTRVKRNIEKYRNSNVRSGDVEGVMVSSKSYLFKGGTRPDVALYDKGGQTPSKYTDFYKEVAGDLKELTTCYKDEDFSADVVSDIWCNFASSFREMASRKKLVVIAEEYRVPGATEKNNSLDDAGFAAVLAYKKRLIEMVTNGVNEAELKKLKDRAFGAFADCTWRLPWAGTGGKKFFLQNRIKDLKDQGFSDNEINEELDLDRDDYYPYNIDSPSITVDNDLAV